MATMHISEAEAAGDFAGLMAMVRAGAEVVIENARTPVAVMRGPAPARRTLAECIAMLPEHSTAVIDEDFAKDVSAAQGDRVALGDLLIGVTALEAGFSVATANVRHFGMIPGLDVVTV